MPWDEETAPAAMQSLPGPVRAKALEIANTLLEQDYPEDKVLRMALNKARAWADLHWEEEIDWDDLGIDLSEDR